MIHLLRHADAGHRAEWDRPDELRPLSEHGWAEARLIAAALAPLGVQRILTSPYLRCIQSVEPLSEMLGLPVEIEEALAEGTTGERVDALFTATGPGSVLCTHGDVISYLIGHAAAEGAVLDGDLIWQKGSIWHLETGPGGRIVAAAYDAPPAVTL